MVVVIVVVVVVVVAVVVWNSLLECFVKCGTVQTFRCHLDKTHFSKFITYQFSMSLCCLYLLLHIVVFFFLFFSFFAGEGISVFLGPSLPRS